MTDILPTLNTLTGSGSHTISRRTILLEINRLAASSNEQDRTRAVLLRAILANDTFQHIDSNRDEELSLAEIQTVARLAGGQDQFTIEDVNTLRQNHGLPAIDTGTPAPPTITASGTPQTIRNYITSDSYIPAHIRGTPAGRVLPQTIDFSDLPPIECGRNHYITMFIGKDNKLHLLIYPRNLSDQSQISEIAIPLGPTNQVGRFEEFLLRQTNPRGGYKLLIPGRAIIATEDGFNFNTVKNLNYESGIRYSAEFLPCREGYIDLRTNEGRQKFLDVFRQIFISGTAVRLNLFENHTTTAPLLNDIEYRQALGIQNLSNARFVPMTQRNNHYPRAFGSITGGTNHHPTYLSQTYPASGGHRISQSENNLMAWGGTPFYLSRVTQGDNDYFILTTFADRPSGSDPHRFLEIRVPANAFFEHIQRTYGMNLRDRPFNEVYRFFANNYRFAFHNQLRAFHNSYLGFSDISNIPGIQWREGTGQDIEAAMTACRGATFNNLAPTNITPPRVISNNDTGNSTVNSRFNTARTTTRSNDIVSTLQIGTNYMQIIYTDQGFAVTMTNSDGSIYDSQIISETNTPQIWAALNNEMGRRFGLNQISNYSTLNPTQQQSFRYLLSIYLSKILTLQPRSGTGGGNPGVISVRS